MYSGLPCFLLYFNHASVLLHMIISIEDFENRYIYNGSEIMIINSPKVTTKLLQEIKKTKRIYIIENKLYEYFDRRGISDFIDAIDAFDFKLFHFCDGILEISVTTNSEI